MFLSERSFPGHAFLCSVRFPWLPDYPIWFLFFRCFGFSLNAFLHLRQTSCILFSRFVFCHIFLYNICFGIPFWLSGSVWLGFRTFNPSLITLFSCYHAHMHRFFRCIGSFRGFSRFGTTLRQFFLSCAVQFTVPGIGVLEINEVLSLGLMPLSCIVIHTPTDQVTVLYLSRESSVFFVCSLAVRELFSMHLGYSTYWNSLAWMLPDSFRYPSILFPILLLS